MPQNPNENIDQLNDLTVQEVIVLKLDDGIPDASPVNGSSTDLGEHFLTRANSFQKMEAGGARKYAILRLLGICFGFITKFDGPGNPFISHFHMGDRRAWAADDLTEADLAALEKIVEAIESPSLRSRLGDILWEGGRGHRFGQLAADSYTDLTSRLRDSDRWGELQRVASRGLTLHAKLGKSTKAFAKHVALIAAISEARYSDLDSRFWWGELVQLIADHDGVPHAKLAKLAERRSCAESKKEGSHHADVYMRLAAHLWRKAKSDDGFQKCKEQYGDLLIAKGREGKAKYGAGFAAHWVRRALMVLRQNQSKSEKISSLEMEVDALQKESCAELEPLQIPESDIAGMEETFESMASEIRNTFDSLPFCEALSQLGHILDPLDPEALIAQRKKRESGSLLQMIPIEAIERDGRPQGGARAEKFDEELPKDELYKHLWQESTMFTWPTRASLIDVAREKVREDHQPNRLHVFDLVNGNPFVAPGYHRSYARGIHDGFHGDWLAVPGLILPAFEASVRMILKQRGVCTVKDEPEGVQMERDLGWLLTHDELPRVLGAERVFDLRGVLIEKFGYNLRNAHAHGLMHEEERYDTPTRYFWWQVLSLLVSGAHMLRDR